MDEPDLGASRRVCRRADLDEGEAVVEDVDGTTVAVFLAGGEVHALDGVCPHQGGPLGQGKVEDGCVYCPWHGWQFELSTGEHVHGKEPARTYPVTVEDGDVYVKV